MSKFIAIDLDAQGLFIVAGTARSGHAKVEQALAWTGLESEGGPPALNGDTARSLGEQLRERLKAAGIGSAPVLVSVPRDRVVLKELRHPEVPAAEEPGLIRFQALKELSDSPEEIVLDYTPLSGATPTGERRSMAVVIRKDLYQAIQQMCAAANIRLTVVTPRPYAVAAGLARAIATTKVPPPETKTDAVAVLTIGPAGGEFTVTRNSEVVFTRTVPAPVVASEAMLLAEVRRNLTMYAGANPGQPVQALYVAEADGRWARRLRPALGIPVHAHDPIADEVPDVYAETRGSFAGAAGLLAARSHGDLPINFTTPRQPRTQADPAKNQLLIAGLAALILLSIGGIYGWFKLDAADKEIAQKTAERDEAKKQWATMEAEKKRLDAAEGWKARRVIWLDELYDMADRFPVAGSFYATSFTGRSLPPDQKTGKQENQGAVEVKVTAKNPGPVNGLLEAIDKDKDDPAPKDPKNPPKYYVGADKTIGGPAQGDPSAREYTVFARVNNRPADKFTRNPTFVAPSRKGYPPVPVKESAKEKEKEPETKDTKDKDGKDSRDTKDGKDAPMPKEKN